jgi:hypothetical protein
MAEIINIPGLTCDEKQLVAYNGQPCPLIKRVERLCEENTSYNGDVLDSWETYKTPVGVVERHYWARGPGLDNTDVDWRLIPTEDIQAAQERFNKAALELRAATYALEYLVKDTVTCAS